MNKKLYLIFILIILVMVFAACKQEEMAVFQLPDVSGWKDVEVKYISSTDNIKLAYREFGLVSTNKSLIFVPGSTMYGYYYVPYLKDLAKQNIYVRIIDLRGHGDSEGPRGDVPTDNSLIEDLAQHVKQIKSKNPKAEIFIGGHSMGAGICGRYLETYGYDSVAGVVYVSPFFHFLQPGMKYPGYVEVDTIKNVFGDEHGITHVYHPASDDPKLVREYTKIMSRASMVKDYEEFRKNYTTKTLLLIGDQDELFDYQKTQEIFKDNKAVKYIVVKGKGHINFDTEITKVIADWLK